MSSSDTTLGTMSIVALVLAALTGIIHLVLIGVGGVLFALNGIGYLVLAGALFLPFSPFYKASWLRWVLIGFTAVTVILYVVFSSGSGNWTIPWGPLDKVIEVALIAVLFIGRE